MAELSGGGKLKREKNIYFGYEFSLIWEHETLELYKGLWGNKLHIDLLNFSSQIDKTMQFPVTNSLGGKLGITYYLYLDFCSVPFQLVMVIGLIEWSVVWCNHASA